jgi:hypothetical protein
MTMKDLPEFVVSVDSSLPIAVDLTPLVHKNPMIITVATPLANTEQSQAIPLGAKKIVLRSQLNAILQVGYASGGPYFTFAAGAVQEINQIDPAVAVTLYFKSSKNSDTLYIEYWS